MEAVCTIIYSIHLKTINLKNEHNAKNRKALLLSDKAILASVLRSLHQATVANK
jgi:hypothetical protein